LQIVLVADAKDHGPNEHDYPYFQRTWAELLSRGAGEASAPGGTPAGITVSRAWQWPEAGQWASADVVVAICYLDWSEPRLQQLGAFLARGGGFVVVHAATWTRPEPLPQLAELIGVGGFTRWREGPLELELNSGHPICRGLPATIRLVDEAYWPPGPAPAPGAIEVLATSREVDDGGAAAARPLVWTHRHGKGRVFGCVPGHYNWTLDDPLYRLLLLRGIAWSAGDAPYRFDSLALEGARVAP
jgi:type 1 glutamine amidotransferase